ncbi:MAG: beta-lactamase family protein, partial [Acidobacteriota bacterium]|nr:beta-lactamase family protein [Acidobacteriota bacterium]
IKGDPAWSLAERMKFYKVPGLSVAVIENFKVVWARAYGVKELETKEPVTTDTLFQAGSISKSVNAMVAMKKVEEGKISLDEDINNKLTTWKLPDNEFTTKKKVTLRNLLSHTAGTTVHGFPGYAVTEKVPSLADVLNGTNGANTRPVRVDLEPGTRFRYSGGGTTISQLAIMDIEKKPYPEIAREAVLAPLKMNNSTYSQPLPDDWRKKAATGYRGDGSEVSGKIHVYPEMAAAGLWTTPTDLAKFAIEMQLSIAGRSNKVLKKETAELMTTSFMDNVGLGFFLEKHGKATYFGHGGADEGFRAELLVNRDKGYGVAVMVNSDNGQILREVMRAVAHEYGWEEFLPKPYEIASFDSTKFEGYQGRFQVNPDRVLTIKVAPHVVETPVQRSVSGSPPATRGTESAKLVVEPTGDPAFDLLPISETTFVRRDANFKYEFVRNAAGSVDMIRVNSPGGGNELKRISADAFVPSELLLAGKVAEALDGYRKIKREKPDNVSVSEDRLNNLGYVLMRQQKLTEAIEIFKLNVEFYPNAWNVYDSLGEAYMNKGEKELAIANYKKSLELNPGNEGGAQMLKKLMGN